MKKKKEMFTKKNMPLKNSSPPPHNFPNGPSLSSITGGEQGVKLSVFNTNFNLSILQD